MGASISLNVEVDPPKNGEAYAPGDKVTGTVTVTVKKKVPKKPIIVTIMGQEKAEVVAPPRKAGTEYVTKENKILYEASHPLEFPKLSGHTVEPGEYPIKFEINIPTPRAGKKPITVPTGSVEEGSGKGFNYWCRIRHVVRAKVQGEDKPNAKAEFRLVNLASPTPGVTPYSMLRPYKNGGKGNVSVGFMLEDARVRPGGLLKLRAVVRNRSSRDIKKVCVKLVESQAWQTKITPNAPNRRGLHNLIYLDNQCEHTMVPDQNITDKPSIVTEKMSSKDIKEKVQNLERVNNAFKMERGVQTDITAAFKKLDCIVTVDIPAEGINCSYKGTLVTFSHRLEVTIISGSFLSKDTCNYSIPITIGHFKK